MRRLDDLLTDVFLAYAVAFVVVATVTLVWVATSEAATHDQAWELSKTCQTPTSWIVTTDDGRTWTAQCGDEDGRRLWDADDPRADATRRHEAHHATIASRVLDTTWREVRALTEQARRDRRRRALDAGAERWSRLVRPELGYGWGSDARSGLDKVPEEADARVMTNTTRLSDLAIAVTIVLACLALIASPLFVVGL